MALMRCTGLHMDVPGKGKGQRAKVKDTLLAMQRFITNEV